MKKSTFLFMVSLYCFSSNIAAVSLSDAKLVPSLSTPGDATEFTQVLNHLELVAMYGKQLEQYATELSMYNDMVKHGLTINNQQWTNVSGDITGVMSVVQQGQSVSFAAGNIAAQFKQKYPGYQAPTDYQTSYKSWAQSSMDALRAALEASGLQSQNFATEEGVLSQLRNMSQTSQGRMQAIQVGNQVAVEQVAQMQKLRQLVMAQNQAQSNYLAAERTDKDAKEAEMKELLQYTQRPKVDHQYFKGGTE